MGPRKWKDEHTNFCASKFTANPNEVDKWYVDKDKKPPVTAATLKNWYNEVAESIKPNEHSIWSDIDSKTFARNVKTAAIKFASGPRVDTTPNNATNHCGNKEAEAVDVDEDNDEESIISGTSYSEGTLESTKTFGDTISLAYTQCVYGISHKDNVQTSTSKCHIIIQPVSGWSIREESTKGDFIKLTSNGTKLVLNIRANAVLFDALTARSILINSGLFNQVYKDGHLGSTHPAVGSLGVAIANATTTRIGANEVPSHTLTIPLLSSFKSVCAVEGLDADPVPQVSCSNLFFVPEPRF